MPWFTDAAYGFLSEMKEYKRSSLIMIYLSLEGEAPTDEFIIRMLEDGKRVCVPVTGGCNMMPAEIGLNTVYKKGAFGVREPSLIKRIEKNDIDIVIAPGLLFDRRGNRCGYGKGCYDLFLEGFDTLKIGLAFDRQVINAFPTEKHDIKMDYIITEKGLIACEEKNK